MCLGCAARGRAVPVPAVQPGQGRRVGGRHGSGEDHPEHRLRGGHPGQEGHPGRPRAASQWGLPQAGEE
eukprot:8375671-Pyramimonas_sp.AAC.1